MTFVQKSVPLLIASALAILPACGQSGAEEDDPVAATAADRDAQAIGEGGAVSTVPAPDISAEDTIIPGENLPAGFDASDTANWRQVDPENLFIFETTKGRVYVEAFPEVAPNHVDQFRTIIRSGDYAGTKFHRVIDDFMAQGGDIEAAKGRTSGLPDLEAEFTFQRDPYEWTLAPIGQYDSARFGFWKGAPIGTQSAFLAEMNETGTVESWIPHCPYIMSTARTDDPNSANSQFFWIRGTADWLDRQYTAWGRVIDGRNVVTSIKPGARDNNGAVDNPDVLMKASVAADLSEGERPVGYVQRTDGPKFTDQVATVDHDVDICELEPVPSVVIDAGN